ncbi:MAG: tetratricopeptide repeat protein [Desulfobacterium sp.]|nr:tetratricopeptide repeat protein [Desulfobacterium sp.]
MTKGLTRVFKVVLLCFLTTLLVLCCTLFWPRYQYQRGIIQLELKNYPQAMDCFDRAEKAIPRGIGTLLARPDLYRIYSNHGIALYNQGVNDWEENNSSMGAFVTFVRAKQYLTKAADIDPLQYLNSYWLAMAEQALEKTYGDLYPETNNPYDALPFFKKALPLRPSGITLRYAYIRYLEYKGLGPAIPELVEYMMEIHPPSYWDIKKETFFNNDLMPFIERGLNRAIKREILASAALGAMSDIYFNRQDFQRAISYYRQSLDQGPSTPSSNNYIHMGRLLFKSADFEQSFDYFAKALKASASADSVSYRIYNVFKSDKLFEEFLKFFVYAREKDLATQALDMCVARCWLEMDRPELAKARLITINAKQPHAPAFYLLAQLAEQDKDWNQMELAAQKATTLDRKNSTYFYLFSRSLQHQKKYAPAEQAATRAIDCSDREDPRLFNHRAWIRWYQKEYAQAAADWEKAFTLKPNQGDFPYWIALAWELQGSFNKALAYIEKAIALDPDNKRYNDLKTRLETYSK